MKEGKKTMNKEYECFLEMLAELVIQYYTKQKQNDAA